MLFDACSAIASTAEAARRGSSKMRQFGLPVDHTGELAHLTFSSNPAKYDTSRDQIAGGGAGVHAMEEQAHEDGGRGRPTK